MPIQRKPVLRNFIVGGAVENQEQSTTTFDGRHVAGVSIGYRGDMDR
jgi:hemolysin activation/secretion protein